MLRGILAQGNPPRKMSNKKQRLGMKSRARFGFGVSSLCPYVKRQFKPGALLFFNFQSALLQSPFAQSSISEKVVISARRIKPEQALIGTLLPRGQDGPFGGIADVLAVIVEHCFRFSRKILFLPRNIKNE
jgi:hypothetical protein